MNAGTLSDMENDGGTTSIVSGSEMRSDQNKTIEVNNQVYACELCSATFNRHANYTRHKMIHSVHPKDGNRYQCDECGRSFLQKCDLKRHLLIHSGKQPYNCQYCEKRYIRKSDLVVHTRFHTKERAFKCDQCDKAFFQSGDLYRHKRRAHERNTLLTCGHCNKKYTKETTLIRHMQSAHKDVILMSLGEKLTQQTRSITEEPPIVVAVPQDVLTNVSLSLQPEGAEDSNLPDHSVTTGTCSQDTRAGGDDSATAVQSVDSLPQTNLVFSNAETVIVTEDVMKMGITAIEITNTGSHNVCGSESDPSVTSTIIVQSITEPPAIIDQTSHLTVHTVEAVDCENITPHNESNVHSELSSDNRGESSASKLPGIDSVISINKACN